MEEISNDKDPRFKLNLMKFSYKHKGYNLNVPYYRKVNKGPTHDLKKESC